MNKDVYSNNKLFHFQTKLRLIAKQIIVAPVNLQVDLTNRCNNRCTWCFYDAHALPEFTRKMSLSREVALRVPGEFKASGGKSIEWTGGGEPTLHPDFADVVEEARSVGVHQAMVTNGKTLENRILDECLDFDWLRISLNCASTDMYEVQHGNDSFRRVIYNIEDFAKNKSSNCVLGVSMIVDNRNYKEIAKMVALSKSLGADNARISVPQTPLDDKLFEGIWDDVLAQMKQAKEYETNTFTVFTNEDRIDTLAHRTRSDRCYYHHVTPSLGANGAVYPCCHFKYLPKYNLGSINDMSFEDVWNGEARRKFIKTTGEYCSASCWMNGKNTLADYIIKEPDEVPHLYYP